MKIYFLIPARAGSKGIPNKNLKSLAGRPLIEYSIDFAKHISPVENIIVSSDSEDILSISRASGIISALKRPEELASDEAPMIDVIKHAMDLMKINKNDYICLLQPTSPFRRYATFKKCKEKLMHDTEATSIITVDRIPDKYSPYGSLINDGDYIKFFIGGTKIPTRRQDFSESFIRNGQIYIFKASNVHEKNDIYGSNCMSYLTNHEAVNLDDLEDWKLAEKIIKTLNFDGKD